jgi:hypothetical protein
MPRLYDLVRQLLLEVEDGLISAVATILRRLDLGDP